MRMSTIIRRGASVLLPILVVSVGLNLVLSARLKHAQAIVGSLKDDGRIRVGASVPPIEGISDANERKTIRYDDSTLPTVLYVIRPGCMWCERNEPNMDALVATSGRTFKVVVLFLGTAGMDEYEKTHPSVRSRLVRVTDETKNVYKLGGTPQTILVGADGLVKANWLGAYTDELLPEIQDRLGVSLPGMRKAPPAVKGNKTPSGV